MKTILFLFFFIINLFPQVKIDSIYREINNKPEDIKFHKLSDLCWNYRYNDSKLALEFGQKALVIAQKNHNKSFEAQILNRIGVIHKWLNDLELSMQYFQDALTAANESKDSIEIGYAENNIGGTYQYKMFNTLAIEHMLIAQRIFEKLNYKPGLASCLVNMAANYWHRQNYSKALEYNYQALNLRYELGEKHGIALSINGIASLYLEKGDYDSARIKFNEVERYAREMKDRSLLASAYAGLSKVELNKKNYRQAANLELKSLAIIEELNVKRDRITGLLNLANILIQQKDFYGAEKNLGLAYQVIKTGRNGAQLPEYYSVYSHYYEMKGEFEKSLYYNRLYSAMQDSNARLERLAQGDELQEVRKYLNLQNQNTLLQKTLEFEKGNKERGLIISILMVLTILVLFWRYRIKKTANKKLRELNAMKDLFFGIVAHDLKNPFHTILSSSELLLNELEDLSKEEIKEIVEIINNSGAQTFKLLENLLYWSLSQTGGINYTPETVSLVELVTETIALNSNTAFSKNISLVSDFSEDLVAVCDKEMIKLVLRNLVSNGIKYTKEGGSVEIVFRKKGKFVEVSVKDDGVGMSPDKKNSLIKISRNASTPGTHGEKGTGLGLILCREFVEKNNGHLIIESEVGHGSRFIFTLPAFN